MKNEEIVIVGARLDGQAGVVMDTLDEIGGYEVIGFIDNTPGLQGKSVSGIPVIGSTDNLEVLQIPKSWFHIAIGDNIARYKLYNILKKRQAKILTIIHPSAIISRQAIIGEGCFVSVNAVIRNGADIGCVSIINTSAIVEHDNKIGNAVHIAPGVHTGGCVHIADYSFIGLGSTILPNIKIGSGVMIGAGGTITKDVASNMVMMGYAAKPHKKNIYKDLEEDTIKKELSFLTSAMTEINPFMSAKMCLEWLQNKREKAKVNIKQIPFAQMDKWSFDEKTGNLFHETGKFFSIEGVYVKDYEEKFKEWSQPIINQPEIGILGIITKEFDGVLYFLLQAKIEPGNVNLFQLSPTIQATKSNFTRVHKGTGQPYLPYFTGDKKVKILVDQLQSEQGARFIKKRNRNIIVETEEDVIIDENYCWLTLAQIKKLMEIDNTVNMDTRTVISCISFGNYDIEMLLYNEIIANFSRNSSKFQKQLFYSFMDNKNSLHTMDSIMSWLTKLKAGHDIHVKRIPLKDISFWNKNEVQINHESGKYFSVIAVSVDIDRREVQYWTQPLLKPSGQGIIAFLIKKINGIYHFLVQAKFEPGNFDIIEMAPTVQCLIDSYRGSSVKEKPPFLDYVLNAKTEDIRYSALQSEEGGRFYQEQNRNLIIEVDNELSIEEIPENFIWMSLNQLSKFIKHNNYVNIQARSLIAALKFI